MTISSLTWLELRKERVEERILETVIKGSQAVRLSRRTSRTCSPHWSLTVLVTSTSRRHIAPLRNPVLDSPSRGRLAQWQSASFTRKRPQVRYLYRPPSRLYLGRPPS